MDTQTISKITMPGQTFDLDELSDALLTLQQGQFQAAGSLNGHNQLPPALVDSLVGVAGHMRALAAEIELSARLAGVPVVEGGTLPLNGWERLHYLVQEMASRHQTLSDELRQMSAEAGRVEQRLHERRRQLHLIIASMPNALLMVDEQLQLKAFFIPPGFPPIMRTGSLNVGEPVASTAPAECADQIDHALRLARDEGQSSSFECTWQMDDDEPLFFEIRTSPITDSLDLLVLINNISERRRAAQEVMRLKDDFVASVSHELRTPIYAVKGFLDLLLTGKVEEPEVQHEFLVRASQSAERLTGLVNDLLDVTQLESSEFRLDPQPFDLADLLAETVAALQPLAHEKKIIIHVDVPIEPLEVCADRRRIQQVVTNLLGNAIKFSEPGQHVGVRGQRVADGVRVDVIDQGPGIPPDAQPYLFAKFYQVEGKAKRAGKGTGLGLYLSKKLVERHGGQIGLDSEVGQGSNFYFVLPDETMEPEDRS